MACRCALAALLALAAGCVSCQGDDAVSLLQSAAQGAAQSALQPWQVRHLVVEEGEEDTRSQTFVKGEVAELRSQRFDKLGGWVICNVIGPARDPNTYDVVVPGTAILRGIPALMLRKKRKASTTISPPLEARLLEAASRDTGSIDGEPGEQVEILVRKGSRAGSWVPGTVDCLGSNPDAFDIRVFTKDGGSKVLHNVPGLNLRKARMVTTPAPRDATYKVGDKVDLRKSREADGSKEDHWVSGWVSAPGASPDTYTIYVNDVGYVPDVPKQALRPSKDQGGLEMVLSKPKEVELSDYPFMVGEDVDVRVVGGAISGFWLKARIAVRGTTPFTYLINFTQWKIEEMVLMPAFHEMLRRPGQNLSRAAQNFFEIGERVEFKTMEEKDAWFNATIVAKGEAPDSFDIMQGSGKIIPSFPVEMLRKAWFDQSLLPKMATDTEYRVGDQIEYKNIVTGYWNNGTVLAEGKLKGTYDLDAGDFLGTVLRDMPPELLRRPATSFQEGDAVEVEGQKGNETIWSRCKVRAMGKLPDTYDLVHQDLGVITAVPFKKLRKACSVAPKYMLNAYEAGEKVEVKVLYGASAGEWVPGKIASRGSIQYTYNVTIPGAGLSPNIPIELVRKVASSRFKVGEFVKVKLAAGPTAGTWETGLVSRRGSLPEMWDITIWSYGVIPNVPAELLMKINQPYRQEDIPVYEVGTNVKVRCLIGPDKGKWLPGIVKGQSKVINTTAGDRFLLYKISLPTFPELGEINDVNVELIQKDEFAMRPLSIHVDLKVNDTVQLRGMVGPSGAPWIKIYVHKNGTRRETYDLHLPGVGIFTDIPIELMRRPGTRPFTTTYEVGQMVEMKDIFDMGQDKLWFPMRVKGKGRRPMSYDCGIDGTPMFLSSVPVEILRRADGQEFRMTERNYYPGEIVETKDVLGVIAPNATTKVVFRILGEGSIQHTYDVQAAHIGIIRDVPVVLIKKVKVEDLESMDDEIAVGDYVDCLDVDKPGSRVLCYVDAIGERPGTWNVRMMGYVGVFPNIPVTRLYKKPIPLVDLSENSTAAAPPPTKKGPKFKVGDWVEVFDKRKKKEDEESQWVEAVIIGEGKQKKSWDIKVGDAAAVYRNVPEEKLRIVKDEEEAAEVQTTQAPKAQDEPLGIGDPVRYRGPGTIANDTSTWTAATIVADGKVPYTFDIGLESGFVVPNIPFFHLMRDWRFVTTTASPDAANTHSVYGLIMPTIRLFQEVFKKQEDDYIKEHTGDEKALLVKELNGKFIGDGSVTFDVGEKAEVQITKGEYKGMWVQCIISGLGKFRNSYNIHMPEARDGFRDIPNVGAKVLRKIGLVDDPERERIRAASPCTEAERVSLSKVISSGGLFSDNPEECQKVFGVLGVNQDNVGQCAQKKFSISGQCSQCLVNFGKDAAGTGFFKSSCVQKCVPAMQAVKKSAEDPNSFMASLGECLTCVKTPLAGLLKCIGTADSTTTSKLEQLNEAIVSGQILMPGSIEGIYGGNWVSHHRDLLAPFLGSLLGNVEAPVEEPEMPNAGVRVSFEVGEQAELRIQKGPFAGSWVECNITGVGGPANTYNVHIPTAPKGQQDYPDVSALILRKSEANPEEPSTPDASASNEDPL